MKKVEKTGEWLYTNELEKKSENDLEDVVKEIVLAIYAKEIKEKKEGWRNTYLIWLMTYLETLHVLPCLEAFNA